MKKFDKFLDFLFHTKRGIGVLMLAGLSGSLMFSGCFITNCLSCACDDSCDGCWSEADSCINNCVSCGGDCENTIFTAFFGEGCTGDCNGNDCTFSCNPTDWDCSCGGSSGCSFGCFSGCSPQKHSISLTYINTCDGKYISSGYVGYGSVSAYEEETTLSVSFDTTYFTVNGFYTDSALTNKFAEANGAIIGGSVTDVNVLYVSVTEKYYGESRRFTFDAKVDGVRADSISAFYDWFVGSVDLYIGSTISNFPTAPEVEGYTFEGWTYNGSSITINNGSVFHLYDSAFGTSNSSYTLVANYSPIKYTVSVDGSESTYEVAYGTTVSEFIEDNNISGEDASQGRFVGWTLSEGGDILTGDEVITANVTLYPVYYSPVTIILYDYYGPDTGSETVTDYYVTDTFKLPNLTSVGINYFAGWYSDSQYTNQVSSVELTATQYTFYAKWTQVTTYKIYYYVPSVSLTVDLHSEIYEYSETDTYALWTSTDLDNYAPSGTSFVGWCKKSDCSDTPITELPAGTYGDFKLYAKYSAEMYTVKLHPNGGEVSSTSVLVEYGSNYTLPVPTRTGYDFDGWYLSSSSSLQVTDENGDSLDVFSEDVLGTISNKTITFYAHWSVHKYTITFKDSDGNTVYETDCEYGTAVGTISTLTAPDKKGYTFEGWYNGNKEFDPTALVYADCTYTAKYTVNTYTITLDANGGTVNGNATSTITITYGATKTLPDYTSVIRSGYTFDGWGDSTGKKVADFDGSMYSTYDYDSDITLYAIWTDSSSASVDGGQTLSVDVGADITICDYDKNLKNIKF